MIRATLFIFFTLIIYSEIQASNIKGRVLAEDSNTSLPYASIALSGKYLGTVSNSEGYFLLSSDNFDNDDTLLISYMGYETLRVPFPECLKKEKYYLKSANINLSEVKVYSKNLSASDIINKVLENYPKNHPERNEKQRVFIHNFIKTPFSENNKARVLRSNFTGLDKVKFDELLSKIPDEFIDYNDAIVDYYTYETSTKLIPIQGISIEEGDQQALLNEVEKQLEEFIDDFEKTLKNPDIYYKFKTGILGFKLNTSGTESEDLDHKNEDSLSFKIPVGAVKYETKSLIENFSTLDGENTEFLDKAGKYIFELQNIEFINGEFAYRIKFKPKRSGIFQGEIYISTSDFGIHQMDYSYAVGKSTENIKILGIGHAINYRKGRIIFEKRSGSYHLKYIKAEEHEMGAVDRKFSLIKKQKRFLIDKKLNEIKFDLDLVFNVKSNWELLVLQHEEISEDEFEKVQQPKYMSFKKQLAHSSQEWENRTYIVPSEELKKYTRKKITE